MIHGIGETIAAGLESFAQPLNRGLFGSVAQLAERVDDHVGAEPLGQLPDAPFAKTNSREASPGVSFQHIGEAGIAEKHAKQFVIDDTGFRQADRRDDDSFLEDVGAVGRDRARSHAADIREMGPTLCKGDDLAIDEYRCHEDLVRGM